MLACRLVRLTFALLVTASLLATQQQVLSAAEQLRIETEVFLGDEPEPVSHTVTLFDSGAVYDFVDQPAQIAVFRSPTSSRPGQFVLLDLDTKERTEVATDRIEALMKKLTRWAQEQDDPLIKFSAKPDFEETFDSESGILTLTGSLWRYQVASVPAENAKSLNRYREFTDWYTRLNTMMHGTPPPGPRLKLNAALEKHGVVPVEIRRTVDSDSTSLRATHLFTWRLSKEDRARLEQARRYLTSFEKVDNKDFLEHRGEASIVRGQSK